MTQQQATQKRGKGRKNQTDKRERRKGDRRNGNGHHAIKTPIHGGITIGSEDPTSSVRTFHMHWKPHVFVEMILPNDRVAKPCYMDFVDSWQDRVALGGSETLEADLFIFYLMGMKAVEEFIYTHESQPAHRAKGFPTDPPLNASVRRVFNERNAVHGASYLTWLSIHEVIQVQDALHDLSREMNDYVFRQSFTLGLVLAVMRRIQDFGHKPRLVIFFENMQPTGMPHPADGLGKYRA